MPKRIKNEWLCAYVLNKKHLVSLILQQIFKSHKLNYSNNNITKNKKQ